MYICSRSLISFAGDLEKVVSEITGAVPFLIAKLSFCPMFIFLIISPSDIGCIFFKSKQMLIINKQASKQSLFSY